MSVDGKYVFGINEDNCELYETYDRSLSLSPQP